MQRLGRLLGLTHIQSGKSYNPSNWQNLSVLESLCTTGSKKLAKYLEYIVFLGESLWANSQIRTSPLNKHSRKRAITRSLSAANILLKAVRTLLDEQHLAKESVFEVETYVDFLKCERETLFEAPQDQALVDHLYATLKSLKLVRSRYSANDISRQTVAFMDLKISEILNLLKSAPKSLTLDVDLAMSLEQLKGKDSCESDVELLLVDKLSPSINKLWADFRVFHQEPAKPVSIPSKKRNELLWKSKGHVNQIIKVIEFLFSIFTFILSLDLENIEK